MESSSNGSVPVTILIAVAVRLYREGLAAALGTHAHLHVVGTAATPAEAEAAAGDVQPDVIIVDVAFDDVCNLIRTLRAGLNSRIVAFAVREEISAILEYASAGADGFATANSSLADVVQAIERTAAGELLCSPQIAAQLLRRAAVRRMDTPTVATGPVLTGREQQVLTLLNQGQSNKEIANALNISPATVKNHVHHLLAKLQVTTRGQAMALGAPVARTNLPRQAAARRAG